MFGNDWAELFFHGGSKFENGRVITQKYDEEAKAEGENRLARGGVVACIQLGSKESLKFPSESTVSIACRVISGKHILFSIVLVYLIQGFRIGILKRCRSPKQ